MGEEKVPRVGDAVIYTDPKGRDHNAILTAVWTPTMVNLVFVSEDDSKTDSYGRQIERTTSLSHVSESTVHGFYWRRPGEDRNVGHPPLET